MKSTPTSSLNSRLDFRLAAYAAAGAAIVTATAPGAEAAVVYSGPVSIAVPATTEGVYLDLVTGAASATAFAGYDFNPYAYFTGDLYFYTGSGDGVVGSTGAATSETPLVSTVSSSSSFLTGIIDGTNFDETGTEYAGIEFQNDTTGATNYGWVELATTGTTGFPASIVGYAYDNAGGAIVVGQTTSVPEPGTTAALGLGALSLGAAGVRRWRKSKQAVA